MIERAAQILAQVRAAAGVVHLRAGDEQHGLGRRVRRAVPQRADDADLAAQAQRREDVADLRDGGIGDHQAGRLGAHRADGAHDHAQHAEDEQHVQHAQRADDVKADHADVELDQQEDIALRYQAGEHRRHGRGRVGVRARQPLFKRIQRALDRNAHRHQRHDDRQRNLVFAAGRQRGHTLVDVDHQQMAGDGVENRDAEQEQARADEVHDHVAHAGHQVAALLAHHDQARRRQRVDLDEDVGREDVVGVHQRLKRQEHEIDQDAVDVVLGLLDLADGGHHAADKGEERHEAEDRHHQRFNHADADLVAPRGREVAHHVHIAVAGGERVAQHTDGHRRHRHDQAHRQPAGRAALEHGGDDRADQRQQDAEERKVLYEVHQTSSFPASAIISSRLRV